MAAGVVDSEVEISPLSAIPAETGIHISAIRAADRWNPAVAGMAIWQLFEPDEFQDRDATFIADRISAQQPTREIHL